MPRPCPAPRPAAVQVRVSSRPPPVWLNYRAVDQHGQVIDVLTGTRHDQAAARRFYTAALSHGRRPAEVTTDKAPVYPRLLDEVLPEACHVDAKENNRIEADHSRLKARLRPMRGLK